MPLFIFVITYKKSPLTARMLVGGNFARQGAPSESDEAVVTCGESLESRSNAVLGDLYNRQALSSHGC